MKQLLTAFSIVLLIAFITGCGVNDSDDNPSRFGTWRIDSNTHATWLGSQVTQAMKVAFNRVSTDSVTADTTYFFSNEDIQVAINEGTSRPVYEGEFEFFVIDSSLSDDILYDSLAFDGIEVQNIGSAFSINGYRGSSFGDDAVNLKIQASFDCNDNDDTGNLRIAFLTLEDEFGEKDTSMVYELSTEGLYSTASYVTGCN